MNEQEYTVEAVRRVLAQDPRVAELELDVEVTAETILVTGTVATEERRDAIPVVLGERFPAREVVCRIDVVRTDGGAEETIA